MPQSDLLPKLDDRPLRLFGIDPGSLKVGYACVEIQPSKAASINLRDIKIVEVGALRAPSSQGYAVRISLLHNAIFDCVARLGPSECVIERAFSGINPLSGIRLGEARGSIISAVARNGALVKEITAGSVKKIIGGKGNATKEQIAQCLYILLGFSRGNLPYDATDALAIAIAYVLSNRRPLGGSRSEVSIRSDYMPGRRNINP